MNVSNNSVWIRYEGSIEKILMVTKNIISSIFVENSRVTNALFYCYLYKSGGQLEGLLMILVQVTRSTFIHSNCTILPAQRLLLQLACTISHVHPQIPFPVCHNFESPEFERKTLHLTILNYIYSPIFVMFWSIIDNCTATVI